jgi:peptidoglycan hydrolase-like protein with peptidoglycan-binding domain
MPEAPDYFVWSTIAPSNPRRPLVLRRKDPHREVFPMMLKPALLAPLAAAALALAPLPAPAQSPQGLVYAQPLSPQAMVRVQERLRDLGAYNGRPDGVWGPDSQAALERFQQGRGLQVSGQLNPATVATLGLSPAELVALGAPTTGGPAVGPGAMGGGAAADLLSPGAVRNIQQRLRVLGFYRGGVDGLWGPGTQAALERFQQGRGLQASGQVNPATLTALGLDPNDPAARIRR